MESRDHQWFIMDGHCDTLEYIADGKRRLGDKGKGGHLDLPRMVQAGVGSQIFAVYVSDSYLPGAGIRRALSMVDAMHREVSENADRFGLALCGDDVRRLNGQGKVAGFLSLEGAEALDGSIAALRCFYRLGVRLMGLTWSRRNEVADGCYEERTGSGLTRFGEEVVREMDRLGMVVDVSHLSEASFWDLMKVSGRPVIASHSNCRALCDHRRNLTDDQARAIASKSGVICITFVGAFLGEDRRTLNGVLDHIDHFADLIGPDHVGVGSDFDGMDDESLPQDIRDVTALPSIAAGLTGRGYSSEEVKGIMGANLLRVVESVIG